MDRLRSTLLNLALLAGSALLTVLLLEGALRLVTGDRYLDVDLRLRHGPLVFEPSQHMRWKRIEWDVDYTINARGMRDEEYTGPAPRSLVALGDSFTEGYGVAVSQSWAKRLEALLAGTGRPWRVYNAGVQGRAPEHYYGIYDRFFKKDPGVRLAIMGFNIGTDIETTVASPIVSPPMNRVYFVKRFLCEHSVVYNFIRRPARLSPWVRNMMMRAHLMGPLALDMDWTNLSHEPQWDFTAGRIEAFRKRLRAQGRELVVMLIPNKEQVEVEFLRESIRQTRADASKIDPLAFGRYMSQRAAKTGLPLLDLTPLLREADRKNPGTLYFRTDGHWNVNGQAFAAKELFNFLEKKRLCVGQ